MPMSVPWFQTVVPDLPIRVVLVGTGAMGTAWARAVTAHPQLRLVGLVDTDQRRAKGMAIRLRTPELPVTASLSPMLSTVAADACVNATPPEAHAEVTEEALGLDLAVLSEKPFTTKLRQAAQLTAMARSRGRLLMISQSRRYQAGLGVLRARLAGLGAITTVLTEFGVGYPADGFRARLTQPLLTDMAVHAFDAVRFLTAARPRSVYCEAFNSAGSGFAGPPHATAIFEMSGGVRYVYLGSWCSAGLATPWAGRWRVTGNTGSAEWWGAEVRSELTSSGKVHSTVVDDGAFERDRVRQVAAPLDEFVTALRTGRIPWGEAADNLHTMAMVDGAITSARERTRVAIDDLLRDALREADLSVGWAPEAS